MYKNIQAFIAFSLINLTLLGSVAAYANTSPVAIPTSSPESALLAQAMAIQGEGLSRDQAQQELTHSFATYTATAPAEGRAERLRAALVDLKVYTPSQADQFMQVTQTVSSASAVQTAMSKIALPQGAQFSACDAQRWVVIGGGVALAGALLFAVEDKNLSTGEKNAISEGSFGALVTAIILVSVQANQEGC